MASTMQFGTTLLLLALVLCAAVVLLGPRLAAMPGTIRLGDHAVARHGSDAEVIREAFRNTPPACYICADGRKAYCALWGVRGDLVAMMVLHLTFAPQGSAVYWSEVTTYFKDDAGFGRYLARDGCVPDYETGWRVWE